MAFNLLDNKVELNSCIADMAELADALRSGRSGGNPVQVRLLLSALGKIKYNKTRPNDC